jgi:hypothetical protein
MGFESFKKDFTKEKATIENRITNHPESCNVAELKELIEFYNSLGKPSDLVWMKTRGDNNWDQAGITDLPKPENKTQAEMVIELNNAGVLDKQEKSNLFGTGLRSNYEYFYSSTFVYGISISDQGVKGAYSQKSEWIEIIYQHYRHYKHVKENLEQLIIQYMRLMPFQQNNYLYPTDARSLEWFQSFATRKNDSYCSVFGLVGTLINNKHWRVAAEIIRAMPPHYVYSDFMIDRGLIRMVFEQAEYAASCSHKEFYSDVIGADEGYKAAYLELIHVLFEKLSEHTAHVTSQWTDPAVIDHLLKRNQKDKYKMKNFAFHFPEEGVDYYLIDPEGFDDKLSYSTPRTRNYLHNKQTTNQFNTVRGGDKIQQIPSEIAQSADIKFLMHYHLWDFNAVARARLPRIYGCLTSEAKKEQITKAKNLGKSLLYAVVTGDFDNQFSVSNLSHHAVYQVNNWLNKKMYETAEYDIAYEFSDTALFQYQGHNAIDAIKICFRLNRIDVIAHLFSIMDENSKSVFFRYCHAELIYYFNAGGANVSFNFAILKFLAQNPEASFIVNTIQAISINQFFPKQSTEKMDADNVVCHLRMYDLLMRTNKIPPDDNHAAVAKFIATSFYQACSNDLSQLAHWPIECLRALEYLLQFVPNSQDMRLQVQAFIAKNPTAPIAEHSITKPQPPAASSPLPQQTIDPPPPYTEQPWTTAKDNMVGRKPIYSLNEAESFCRARFTDKDLSYKGPRTC